MGFAFIRALAPSNCKWVFATLKVWRNWDLTRVFDRETRWAKVGWVITFQIKSEPCSPWKKYNRSEPSEFSLLKEGRSFRRKLLGVGFFMTALVEMNSFLSGCTRFSNGPYHAIIPDHTAFKKFLNKPWPKRDISGLGLARIRTAPASYGVKRLSLCNMALSERINQTETEKGLEKDDLKNIDEPLQSKLAFELVKIDERSRKVSEKRERKKVERYAYLFAAIASSVGITSMAAGAVYYRFVWQVQGGEVPFTEMFGTFSLAVGATIGMEAWARWAHRALWHSSLWSMHESHHRPREGPFELNDVFAIINAVPAISLLSYGFFNKGFVPGLCFGAGLGITVFGMAYMFVHDGLVHRRFPVGPIADVPYLQRVAAAHQLHHADKFNGVPYGLFLGPKEVEMVGGVEELHKLVKARAKTAEHPTESAKTL